MSLSRRDNEKKRGWWCFQRKDQELRPRTCDEFLSCRSGNTKDVISSIVRIGMTLYILVLMTLLASSIMVLLLDYSVRSHQCEEIYNLWFSILLDCVGYALMFITYLLLWNPQWFRTFGYFIVVYLTAVVVWYCLIQTEMAPICTTFYHIKYPYLKASYNLYGIANIIFLFLWTFYSCGMTFGCCIETTEDEDPIMFSTIFYTKDETWVSPLFEPADVSKYSEGVNKWGTSAEQRVAQLYTTLQNAENVRELSNRQSILLRQVTNMISETEEKVTSTQSLIDQQDASIRSFQTDLEAAKQKLAVQLEYKGGSLPWPTVGDIGCWGLVIGMCCAFFLCLNFAANKWASELAIESPTNVVL